MISVCYVFLNIGIIMQRFVK